MQKSITLPLLFFIFVSISSFAQAQDIQTISLNSGWTFSQKNDDQWYSAEVPGSVQRDLTRLGILPDPFYGTNEKEVQWVEDENWDFRKSFTVTEEQLRYDEAALLFEGLDTHADVFLNGARILRAENMFIGYEIPVKDLLKVGENHLYIRFYSPIAAMMPARATFGHDYPAGNDHRTEKMSVYSRKAPYHFGWDWGIRIVQMGIWKPVSLSFFNTARIEDYYVKQKRVTNVKADIENVIEVYSLIETTAKITVDYSLHNPSSGRTEKNKTGASGLPTKEISLKKGINTISIPMAIEQPDLWMPVNWGKQTLYDFSATLQVDGRAIAEKTVRTGLRSVRLVQDADRHGRSFYFEVNGIPLFAKGANYVPGEIFTTQQDSAYYQRLFDDILAANMNFVRVWGGGTYENETFYRIADEKGIMVWQDFIFGCVPYPSDNLFLKNVREEAIYNIRRLRNHPSLAFWCGNNEVEEGLKFWGWQKDYPQEVMDGWFNGYEKTFRQLLPGLVNQYDGTRSYIHGSPYDSNWGDPKKFAASDAHDWGLWHGRMPFEAMADRLPRFASEYGFQSFPEMKTIRSFAEEKDFDINSEVMKTHQKSGVGNEAIKEYMDMYFHTPRNFEDFVYIGMVMQGNGMEEAIEAMRRGRPYCMGSLYWQINDDWPVVSWSSIDYYGNWKAQHYRARDVYAPLALGIAEKNDSLHFYTLSDYLDNKENLRLTAQVIDFSKGKRKEIVQQVSAKANDSRIVLSLPVKQLLSDDEKHHALIHAILQDGRGRTISTKDHFFFWPNKLDLPETEVKTKVVYGDGIYKVTLSSEKLAKDVFVEIPVQGARFSDNFIDLLPGEKRTIVITSPQLKAAEKTPVTVKHVRQTY